MASISVGSVSIDVVPNVQRFASDIRRQILPQANRIGREVGQEISRGIQSQVGDIQIRVDMGRSLSRVTQLNQVLDRLDGRVVDVEIRVDMAGAVAELRALELILNRLNGRNINIDINVQIAAAMARIAAANSAVSSIDNSKSIDIDVNTGGATASVHRLRTALIELGLLASPAIAGIGAGIIGLIGPLSAAAIGFGGFAAVAIPAVSRVREALQAQQQAQKQAGAAAAQAQSRAFAMASAQQQLASAIRNAGYAHAQALEQVRRAEQELTQAQQDAVRAQRALNDARAEAFRQLQDLSNQVADARLGERQGVFDLADAERELNALKSDPSASEDQLGRAQLAFERSQQQLKEQRLNLKRLIADERSASKAGVNGSDLVRNARDRLADANQKVTDSERGLSKARSDVARTDQQSAEQVASARRALAQASAQGAAANSALAASLAALTPLERELMAEWQGLTRTFQAWAKSLQPAVIPVLIKGINLLKGVLPSLSPIVRASADAIGGLLDRATAASKSPFWAQFSQFLAASAGPAITGLGTLVGSLLKAFAGLAQSFAPIGFAFLHVLNTVAQRFAAFTTGLAENPAFKAFTAQFIALAPLLADTFSSLGSLVGSLFAALAPAMGPILGFIKTLASALASVLTQAGPAIQSVFAALGAGLSQLILALAPVVLQLVQALAPLLVQLIQGLAPILISLTPILSQIIVALAPVIAALLAGLQPALQAVVPLLGLLIGVAAAILQALTPLLVPLGQLIAAFVQQLLPVLAPIAAQFQVFAQEALGALVDAIIQALPYVLQVWSSLLPLLPLLVQLGQQFILLSLALTPLIPLVAQVISILTPMLVPVLGLLIRLVSFTLGGAVTAIRLLVSVVAWWMRMMLGAFTAITGAAAALWRGLDPVFKAIGTIAKWLFSFIVVVLVAPLIIQFKLIKWWATWLWQNAIGPALRGIGGIFRDIWTGIIRPILGAWIAYIRGPVASTIRWIYNTIIKPIWNAVGNAIRSVWVNAIRPAFNALKTAVGSLSGPFRTAVDAIKKAWDRLKSVAKAPVAFVVNTVFNKGIVGVWNAVAKLVPGVGKLSPIQGFASGGIYPGYSPGRDIGFAAVSGGEAIMRPEFTRAVGEDFVHASNAAARSGGVSGVARFLSGVGDPSGVPGFAGNFFLGGVIGKFKDAARGFFVGGLRKAAKRVFDPLLALTDNTIGKSGAFGSLISNIPHALVSKIMAFFGPLEAKLGGPGKKAVAAARSQLGVPYSWGGGGLNGPTTGIGRGANTVGFDCSALLRYGWYQAAKKAAPRTTYGQIPWVKNVAKPVPGAFGFPHSGHVFMASDKPNKIIEAPYTGGHVREVAMRSAKWGIPPWKFDQGGMLPTGPSLVYNGTGRPEPVLNPNQWATVERSMAGGQGGPMIGTVNMTQPRDVTMEEAAHALSFEMRKVRKGGVYAGG